MIRNTPYGKRIQSKIQRETSDHMRHGGGGFHHHQHFVPAGAGFYGVGPAMHHGPPPHALNAHYMGAPPPPHMAGMHPGPPPPHAFGDYARAGSPYGLAPHHAHAAHLGAYGAPPPPPHAHAHAHAQGMGGVPPMAAHGHVGPAAGMPQNGAGGPGGPAGAAAFAPFPGAPGAEYPPQQQQQGGAAGGAQAPGQAGQHAYAGFM